MGAHPGARYVRPKERSEAQLVQRLKSNNRQAFSTLPV